MHSREEILRRLRRQIEKNGHCIGVAAGSGMTARYAVMGGADFILALSAGKFRQVGQGSIASLLCYANSNELVMDFGAKELLPAVPGTPVIFGLNTTDPTIHLYEFLCQIRENGFSGVNNFPTVGLIDGRFRQALEQEGISFARDVEAIRLAHFMDLFTIAFAFDEEQARAMVEAGADVICVHLGLTKGGRKGAKKVVTLEQARLRTRRIMAMCEELRPGIIQMIYGGPISRPEDIGSFYADPLCMGYIGGSAFERIPIEKAILETTQAFKATDWQPDELVSQPSPPEPQPDDVSFIREYIEKNYPQDIRLSRLAASLHRSASYLSTKFKKETGQSFTEYLVRFRLDRAAELISQSGAALIDIAFSVGYRDYAQFSKMFKKYKGLSPAQYREKHK